MSWIPLDLRTGALGAPVVRQGKVLSAKNAASLKAAHAALKALAADADVDLDEPPEGTLGGPTGDIGAPGLPGGQATLDATGDGVRARTTTAELRPVTRMAGGRDTR